MSLITEVEQDIVKTQPVSKASQFTERRCDFCQAPAIEARFRLMEAAYHEDMQEVYKRLSMLEANTKAS